MQIIWLWAGLYFLVILNVKRMLSQEFLIISIKIKINKSSTSLNQSSKHLHFHLIQELITILKFP